MVIAIISEWFSENMGYAENHLPKSFAKLGCEVHVVTSELQIYGTYPEIYKLYEPFLGPSKLPLGTKSLDGYRLHRLMHYDSKYGIGLTGLEQKLQEIKPDVVYLFEINMEYTLQVVKYKPILNYRVFTESRLHLSVYAPPKSFQEKARHFLTERLKWKNIGKKFERCYPVAPDVLHVITKYFGQHRNKCELSSLAVDTDIFKPVDSDEAQRRRDELRQSLSFGKDDIVCIYTGRFTHDKGPAILADAIEQLQTQGKSRFKGLFVGTGSKEYEGYISEKVGCIVHPFVQSNELVKFYQAADIGVWPKQESTSQLDAASAGLPIIISSFVEDLNRIKGNGLSYKHEDSQDLANKIESLEDAEVRLRLGKAGSKKIRQYYSWDFIAKARIKDFEKALMQA